MVFLKSISIIIVQNYEKSFVVAAGITLHRRKRTMIANYPTKSVQKFTPKLMRARSTYFDGRLTSDRLLRLMW